MKHLILFTSLMLAAFWCQGQKVGGLSQRQPPSAPAPTAVEKIADDSLCTSFLIWIDGGVRHHFHTSHTECIYILAGEGLMQMGEEEFLVRAGDYIVVPMGTIHAVTTTSPMQVLSIQTPRWVADDRTFVEPFRRPHNE